MVRVQDLIKVVVQVVIMADGQVTKGNEIVKPNVRRSWRRP